MEKIKAILSNLPEITGKRVYVWGAGNTAMLFREGLSRIPQLHIEAFVDNDPAKQNKTVGDIPIIPADRMIADKDTFVMICTGQPAAFSAITAQLSAMGIACSSIDAAIFGMFKEEVMKAYSLLDDAESKHVYLSMLENRILCRFPGKDLITSDQYFCMLPFTGAAVGESFLDCGAYVGDSIERYIWARDGVFSKIIAFEPDQQNFAALQYRLERLKREWNISDERVSCLRCGVSDTDSTIYVENDDVNNGFSSKMSATQAEGAEECSIVALGRFIESGNCFIKADIESYEYRMLSGAKDAIAKHRPKIAVCIYHNSVDFFSIPLLIKQIAPAYRLAVRHHSFTLSETVLYVYP
ncbi:MAG: FkbM family methyltransferase [Oscillospiraceae bacterium]|nr:FkbM family methyltransferase [Oscillospiraceae bacterium]